jgi:hypothetical protein
MALGEIACSHCFRAVPREIWNREAPELCSGCRAKLRVDVFPAHFGGLAGVTAAERIVAEGDAGCFYHPAKRAVLPCDACGRFLCALCDVEFSGRHLCPSCLEAKKKKGQLAALETERTLYDRIALSLAVYPMLLFYLTLVTAPAAIFVSIRYWKAPGSLVGHSKARFVAALALAMAQVIGWIVVAVLLYTAFRQQAQGRGRPG